MVFLLTSIATQNWDGYLDCHAQATVALCHTNPVRLPCCVSQMREKIYRNSGKLQKRCETELFTASWPDSDLSWYISNYFMEWGGVASVWLQFKWEEQILKGDFASFLLKASAALHVFSIKDDHRRENSLHNNQWALNIETNHPEPDIIKQEGCEFIGTRPLWSHNLHFVLVWGSCFLATLPACEVSLPGRQIP